MYVANHVLASHICMLRLLITGKCKKVNKDYEVLLDYYSKMCDTITDINDFSHYLITLRIITPQDEKELRDTKSYSQQVKKLLDRIVGLVKDGRPQVFYDLLNVMELYGLQGTQLLASEIKCVLGIKDSHVPVSYSVNNSTVLGFL